MYVFPFNLYLALIRTKRAIKHGQYRGTGNSNHNTQNEDKRHEQAKHAIQHNKLKREGTRTLQNPGTDEE